jgi:hypothetical protein
MRSHRVIWLQWIMANLQLVHHMTKVRIAFSFLNNYLCAGDGPAPEEILSCIRTPDCQWIALKTGFGKYVGVDSSAKIIATAEAVGPREKWDVVFQDVSFNCV